MQNVITHEIIGLLDYDFCLLKRNYHNISALSVRVIYSDATLASLRTITFLYMFASLHICRILLTLLVKDQEARMNNEVDWNCCSCTHYGGERQITGAGS